MARFELKHFASDDLLAGHVAQIWVAAVAAAATRGENHLVALSGGRIAGKFFSASVAEARSQRVGFENVHFFWADERCVPPEHPDSNFATANHLLLQPLGVRPAQVHRLRGEEPEISAVASAITDIRNAAPVSASGQPVLDLVLLGMGEDGHVASLFPNEFDEAVASTIPYRAVLATKPPPRRLTLGYSAIAAARAVWVLASGLGKEAALRESLAPGGKTPLGRVLQLRPSTLIFSDIAAG